MEGKVRDVWIPLERVSSGEIRLKIAVDVDDKKGTMVCVFNVNLSHIHTHNTLVLTKLNFHLCHIHSIMLSFFEIG